MTVTDAGFLAAVLGAPDDDAPRLVYADWLDEHGQPSRAEFVRVQCELAKAGPCDSECRNRIDYECRGCALRRRERELLGPTGVLAPSAHARFCPEMPYGWQVGFRRGFVESVTATCEQWLAHGGAVVRAQPVQRVTLSDQRPSRWFRPPHGDWYWVRQHGDTGHLQDRLPPALYDSLPRGVSEDADGVMTYDAQVAAETALSAACIRYAKDDN